MKSPASSRRHTAVGLLLTGIMLFPVYWMLNVSLTPQQDMRKSPPDLFPLHPTFEGYRAVLHDQMPYLGTSLLIGLGTVAATLVLAAAVATHWRNSAPAAAASWASPSSSPR